MTYESGFRGADWVEFQNNPELPGKRLLRYDMMVEWPCSISIPKSHCTATDYSGIAGVVNRLQSVSDKQLITTGSQARSSLVDLESMTTKPFSIGQADSVYPIGNKVYMGVYPEGGLYVYDLNQEPGSTNPQRLAVLGNDQERLVHMSEGDGKLFISTISGYGTLGGSLTVHDTATGETKVHRNVVQNQSVLSTAYVDGKVLDLQPSEEDWAPRRASRRPKFLCGMFKMSKNNGVYAGYSRTCRSDFHWGPVSRAGWIDLGSILRIYICNRSGHVPTCKI